MSNILATINSIKLLVLATFIYACFNLKLKKHNTLLFLIITVSFCTEVLTSILLYGGISFSFLTTLSIIIHHALWLYLITVICSNTVKGYIPLFFFLVFAFVNLFFIEGVQTFNARTFICGALLYVLLFLYWSYYHLRKENFPFFTSNNYLLLASPILFFLGFSFIFGFKNKMLNTTIIFGDIKLYSLISYFVNITYYSLVNIYIYRNKKEQYAE